MTDAAPKLTDSKMDPPFPLDLELPVAGSVVSGSSDGTMILESAQWDFSLMGEKPSIRPIPFPERDNRPISAGHRIISR